MEPSIAVFLSGRPLNYLGSYVAYKEKGILDEKNQ